MWVKKLVHENRIYIEIWNISTLEKKARKLDTSGFKIWYIGKVRFRNGVGIIVDKNWKTNLVDC